MSNGSLNNMEKAFSFMVNGKRKWFIFDQSGKVCWFAEHRYGKYLIRKAVEEDWMYIENGFVDCDFRGCDFSNFDITGTLFTRCQFDCGAFDYTYINYSGMVDCVFGNSGNTYFQQVKGALK